ARSGLRVHRIEARERHAFLDLADDPGLGLLLLDGRGDDLLDERLRDHDGTVVVRDDDVVRKDGDAAATDRLVPAAEGETGDGGRRGGALAPDVEAGREHAGDVAHHAVGDEPGDTALLHARAENVAEDAGIGRSHRVGDGDAAFG